MTDKKEFPSRPMRLGSVFVDRPLYFLTFNTHHRKPILATNDVHRALREYCLRGVELGRVEVGRYVIMPDHTHLFVRGDDAFDLSSWIKGLKRALNRAIAPQVEQDIWQQSFFDHVLRNDESYSEKWEYVRLNPQRAGLVKDAGEWPFAGEICSIHRA